MSWGLGDVETCPVRLEGSDMEASQPCLLFRFCFGNECEAKCEVVRFVFLNVSPAGVGGLTGRGVAGGREAGEKVERASV